MDAPAPLTTVEKAASLVEVDLFKDVPSELLSELAARMEEEWHQPGDVLLEPDSEDVRLWVLVSGSVAVDLGGQTLPALTRGDAFGLLASLGLPQQSTYTAVEACRTLSVAPEEYLDAIADSAAFAIANLRALGRRLQKRERVRMAGADPPDDDGTR